ncbi:MAG TPA: EAL domain-containing protein [Caulobacteraceae bacterium]|jgi:EAL domain-containing protein (putative c-di-GMP-specific phosphodiesterase class I)/GGDEF domain-containing protein
MDRDAAAAAKARSVVTVSAAGERSPPRGGDGSASLFARAEGVLHCAFQPIVDVHNGVVYGVEALARGYEELGCADPLELFDRFVYVESVVALEELLHQRAIDAFAAHAPDDEVRLFLNIDGRALLDKGHDVLERTIEMFSAKGLAPARICVELSERSERYAAKHVEARLQNLRSRGIRFAADDFGLGHAELKLMYDGAIDFVKIDKYFIKGIRDSERQKVFLSSVCRFTHLLGVRVIAEGVETEAEFEVCRDLGCDLVQGWFVDFPQVDLRTIPPAYPHIADIGMKLRLQRAKSGRESPIAGAMITNEPVRDTDPMEAVFEYFRQYPEMDHCAVVDEAREPRGLISQLSLRPFAYNRYGRDLLRNEGQQRSLARFIRSCPSVEIQRTAGEVLDVFMAHPGARGVIVTEAGKYVGLLTAEALLAMVNERRLTEALNRNPLTRLPGNTAVASRISDIVADGGAPQPVRHICYFDFDHFKPFNDCKGFRLGDRAIMLFAEAMQRHLGALAGSFVGHLGGDDFVCTLSDQDSDGLRRLLRNLLFEFSGTVAGLYDEPERVRGWIESEDRFGTVRRFPLLRCSVAVVELPAGAGSPAQVALDATFARLKAAAKGAVSGIAWERVSHSRGEDFVCWRNSPVYD